MLPSIDWITSPIRIHLRNSSELFEILLRFSSDLFPDFYEIFPSNIWYSLKLALNLVEFFKAYSTILCWLSRHYLKIRSRFVKDSLGFYSRIFFFRKKTYPLFSDRIRWNNEVWLFSINTHSSHKLCSNCKGLLFAGQLKQASGWIGKRRLQLIVFPRQR